MFRVSKYSSAKGISYLSGEYVPVDEYDCHHIIPVQNGGANNFDNLCVLSATEHDILHSSTPDRLFDLFPKNKKRIKSLIDSLDCCSGKYVLNSLSKGFHRKESLTC